MLHCVYRVFDNSDGRKFGEANKGKQEKVYEIMYKDRRVARISENGYCRSIMRCYGRDWYC